jgi:putative endonuclease
MVGGGDAAMAATYEQRAAMGAFGERLAGRVLEAAGLEVLDRNWRCSSGEIDIVAGSGALVVVCEVKTRRGDRFGSPAAAITGDKLERLYRLGMVWAAAHGRAGSRLRVDLVCIRLDRGAPHVEHIVGVS